MNDESLTPVYHSPLREPAPTPRRARSRVARRRTFEALAGAALVMVLARVGWGNLAPVVVIATLGWMFV